MKNNTAERKIKNYEEQKVFFMNMKSPQKEELKDIPDGYFIIAGILALVFLCTFEIISFKSTIIIVALNIINAIIIALIAHGKCPWVHNNK